MILITKKITSLICMICFFAVQAQQYKENNSQKKITISAKVIETSTKQLLEYATIVLTNNETKKVYGGITDQNGLFSIKIPKGFYDIKVEFIGFQTKKIPSQQLLNDKHLGTISLSEDNEQLNEVEIVAEKSTVEIKLDKKIYNVGKDMTIKGGNASDVLENVPSVNVDAEGNISLRGNENIRILIDGKPSALVGLNSADALKNLPADAIKKVEVITSPSARYDAEGTAGILNIILRKGKIKGFNGSVSSTIGYPEMYQVSGNLNYKTKKVNLFSNLGYTFKNSPGNATFNTRYFDNNQNITEYILQKRIYKRKRNNYNGTIGLAYYLTTSSSLTGTFTYQKSKGNTNINNPSKVLNENKEIKSSSSRETNENNNDNSYQYALNYTNNFNEKGQKLNIDLQYGNSNEKELFVISNNNTLNSDNTVFTEWDNFLAQIDYVLPLKNKHQIELGHKTDYQKINANFKTLNANNVTENEILDFKQAIYAYYTQYGNKISFFSYLFGLRLEQTKVAIGLIGKNDLISNKDYLKLFPTINLGFEINKTSSISLGYSRRLKRPWHWFLNPFIRKTSSTFIFQGNPDLDPTFTNSFELGYNSKIKKLNFGSSVYYQTSKSPITVSSRIIDQVEIRQPINIDNESRYGFEFTSNYSPAKWIRLSGSFNYFNYKTAPFTFTYTDDQSVQKSIQLNEVNDSSWFTRFSSRVILPGKINWQTRIFYRAAQRSAQTDRKGIFTTNIAFSKDLFNDKASIVFNVSDLFNSSKRIMTTYNSDRVQPKSISDVEFQWRERQISLNFTYRFNQKKKRGKSRPNYENRNSGSGF